MKPETTLCNAIIKAASALRHKLTKNHGTIFAKRGRPDLEGVQYRTGIAIAIEVKMPGKVSTVSAAQWQWLVDVRCTSELARVGVATSVYEALAIIDGSQYWQLDDLRRRRDAQLAKEKAAKRRESFSIDPATIAR